MNETKKGTRLKIDVRAGDREQQEMHSEGLKEPFVFESVGDKKWTSLFNVQVFAIFSPDVVEGFRAARVWIFCDLTKIPNLKTQPEIGRTSPVNRFFPFSGDNKNAELSSIAAVSTPLVSLGLNRIWFKLWFRNLQETDGRMKTRGLGEAARSLLDGRTSGQMKTDGSEGVSFFFFLLGTKSRLSAHRLSLQSARWSARRFLGFFVPVHLLVSLSGRLSLRPASADRLHGKVYTTSTIFFFSPPKSPLV